MFRRLALLALLVIMILATVVSGAAAPIPDPYDDICKELTGTWYATCAYLWQCIYESGCGWMEWYFCITTPNPPSMDCHCYEYGRDNLNGQPPISIMLCCTPREVY